MVFGIQVNEGFFLKKLFSIWSCEARRVWQIGGEGVELAVLGTDCFAKEAELNLAVTEKY